MSRSQQDQFIDDDEEDSCPLCVEEFDLTDKGFRPCPCGYQICQFCYHNVKNNMNGLCPACRRPYNDKDIEYKVITADETAAHRARQAQKQKKNQAALQKEKQKAEADHLSRKHLAGLRVVQKNLVYVTGLSPTTQEDQLLQTLRGDQYFGQYGKIIKIVVSKAKDPSHPHSVGVYVTYERKEDAADCIAAVNGAKNGERTLRAQFGTTKYCSAYLRGEQCSNRQCMFLHEPGEANESYSRADLSALNAGSSQREEGGKLPPPQSQQPVASASASQPMARQASGDQPQSPATDRPALPSTASWASKPIQPQTSRNESRVSSGTVEPAATGATPAPAQPEPLQQQQAQPPVATVPPVAQAVPKLPRARRPRIESPLLNLLKNFTIEDFRFVFSVSSLPQGDIDVVQNYPPLFDQTGGAKRRQRRQREEEERRMQEQAQQFQQPPALEQEEENPEMSGSLQLGGEPEERASLGQSGSAIRPPGQDGGLDQRFQFGGVSSPAGISEPGLTPQQHQQMLLQTMKTPIDQSAFISQQASFQQPPNPPGHQRNVSRFSFANDTASATTSVKPVANPKLLSQQSSIMPQQGGFGGQQSQQFYTSNVQGPPPGLKTTGTPPVSGGMTFGQGHGFATGGIQYSAGAPGRNANEEMMRNLLRGRDAGSVGGVDAKRELQHFTSPPNHYSAAYPAVSQPAYGQQQAYSVFSDGEKQQRGKKKSKKHARQHGNTSSTSSGMDVGAADQHLLQTRFQAATGGLAGGVAHGDDFPPLPPSRQASISLDDGSRISTPPVPPGFEAQLANESRRSTPTVPPGLTKPSALPHLDDDGTVSRPTSRPSSRASLRRQVSHQIIPALPLRPSTPARQMSEVREGAVVEETPTRPPKGAVAKRVESLAAAEKTLQVAAEKPVEDIIAQALASEKEESHLNEPPATPTKVDPAPKVEQDRKVTAPAPEPSPSRRPSGPYGLQPAPKSQATISTSDAKAAPVTPSKADAKKDDAQKRKHPGKLDIAAAVTKRDEATAAATPTDTSTPSKAQRSVSVTPSVASKPDSPSVSSPVVKHVPRTLRVVQTPKAETPPAMPPLPFATPTLPTPGLANKLPSRQPSVASMNPPGTPSSEQVSMSDNISITSTSQSRANSPPPPGAGKVGSAPVRAKTKSQLKKDRQEKAKVMEEERLSRLEETVKEPTEDTAQEAIISRKKKAKKEKEPVKPKLAKVANAATCTADTTPTASRPASPGLQKAVVEEAPVRKESTPAAALPPKPAVYTTPTKAPHTPQQVFPPPMPSPHEPSPPPTPTLTAAQLLSELKASAPEIQKCIDSLFRTPTSSQLKPGQHILPKDLRHPEMWKSDFKINLTKDEVDALLKGTLPAVHYGGQEGRIWDRGMVTPTGAHLRALTEELESRFLDLEKALREMPEELRFRPSKPQNEMKFPRHDLEQLKRQFENAQGRGVSVMEQMVQDGSTMKKGAFLVDEASKYINEFVMPPVTPPPSSGGGVGAGMGRDGVHAAAGAVVGQVGAGQVGGDGAALMQASPEIKERQLHEARRVADEKEGALKKVIKKNKRLLGLG